MRGGIGNVIPITILLTLFAVQFAAAISSETQAQNGGSNSESGNSKKREVIELEGGGPDDLVWVVQLSDLHFSVHHPERARDFREIVGPTLSFIKPSLVLLTGDLTDGKSKDLLTMKQDEEEWIEYDKVMRDVVQRSGLDKSTFYDVRGNHDNFGVPEIGGPFDFFSKYSINEQLQRSEHINSITIQTSKRKLLFVGFDSTMSSGLRGPTNLFGHPTDKLLADINSELSQWDSQPSQPVTKISFAMRILAIDRGQISFVDTEFHLGAKKTIILPTFPLDSRYTSASSPKYDSKFCTTDPLSCGAIRALVFSSSPIVSVLAKIYDASSGNLIVVLDSPMTKLSGVRGDLYVAPWNIRAFEDPSSDRYLLQIESTDIMNRSTFTELRPFSVSGVPFQFRWSWKEFFVMGCQWDSLYYPILWVFYFLVLLILVIPKLVLSFTRRRYTYKSFIANKSLVDGLAWVFMELYNVPFLWFSMMGYLVYLVVCPWFYGQVFTEGGERAYMTYRGWVLRVTTLGKIDFLGFPDVMVVVLMHLYIVVLPTMVIIMALASESGVYRDYLLSCSSKKKDDGDDQNKKSDRTSGIRLHKRLFRKLLVLVSLALVWKHFKSCVSLMKAYEMNPMIHFPVYSFAVPLLLAYTIWKTRTNSIYSNS
ncbi:hypothetical protein CASFOL_003642 [Castilleja foliolosa]|uniref:Calcineurin-like phosphoesterase domain-containing protein n=1 Tax=Castilleja foliolosa TaxID=1961234 RepID=A0ABD3EI55_9LAMI